MISAKSTDKRRFGELLRELRVAKGLSQEELAERAAMSVNGISALERGANQTPQRKTLDLIVRALGLHAEAQEALEAAAARPSRPRAIPNEPTSVDEVPHPATPIFGRDDDVRNVIELLEHDALVTLTGAGGIGKTRLAVCVAETLASRFANVRFVDLAAIRDGECVPCAIEGHTEGLASRPALLVIDNCEHVAAAAASAIAELTQDNPRLRILATSRQSLNVPGEQLYRVAPLSPPAAVELFAERAKRVTPGFALTPENSGVIGRICSRLDGLALAIELAAARTKLLTLDELEARICERFALLCGGSELMLPRHQTMRATIEWSYRLLAPDDQLMLCDLSVFPGSFSLDAALAVCNGRENGEWTVIDALASLVDKSLITTVGETGRSRYRMLETTRAYVTELAMCASDHSRVRKRHLEYYADVADRAKASLVAAVSTSAWARALEPDFENFLAALDWAFGEGDDAATGARLLYSLQEFWMVQGFAAEAARRAQEALERDCGLSPLLRGQLWLTLARMRQELFVHPQQALEAAQRAEELLGGSAERDGLALALRQQAAAHMRLGNFDEARAKFERSLEIYRELGDQRMIARGLGYIASLWQVQGSFAEARATLLDVFELVRAMGDDRMVPTVLMNLAETEFALGDARSAAERATENLCNDVAQKSCDMLATQESNLAAYLLALGRNGEARAMALSSIDDASGSFPAVPLQHFAAAIAETQPRTAARLLGYVECVFTANAFARENTERYTYERLTATLHEALSDGAIEAYRREGALMTAEQAVRLARGINEHSAS